MLRFIKLCFIKLISTRFCAPESRVCFNKFLIPFDLKIKIKDRFFCAGGTGYTLKVMIQKFNVRMTDDEQKSFIGSSRNASSH